jgi:hypothetical protein
VEQVVIQRDGKVYYGKFISGHELSPDRYHDLKSLNATLVQNLKNEANLIPPSQFNRTITNPQENPVSTMKPIALSEKCANDEESQFAVGSGDGNVFSVCSHGAFYIQENSAARDLHNLLRGLITEARSKAGLNP